MIWFVAGIIVCAAVVLAGRAHSRHLDRVEAQWKKDFGIE
jgi:hypothetical protein